jgi:hypothetical protein
MKYYYRCRSNPTAPPLVLHTEWEAKEMRRNFEYDRVDEDGLPIVDEDDPTDADKNSIPFSFTVGK